MELEAITALIYELAPDAVLTAEKAYGDAKTGAGKKAVAKDILSGAIAGALNVLTGDKAMLAAHASESAGTALSAATKLTRKSGAYQAATAQAAVAAQAKAQQPAATEQIEDIHGIAG